MIVQTPSSSNLLKYYLYLNFMAGHRLFKLLHQEFEAGSIPAPAKDDLR